VTDHITSYIRGTSYLITDSNGWDEEVNEDKMWDMLDKHVVRNLLLVPSEGTSKEVQGNVEQDRQGMRGGARR
jgi:hypothetical protein